MLDGGQKFFKHGHVDKEALTSFIKNIKKNTNLSDEDAAVMAASKVSLDVLARNIRLFAQIVDSQPKTRMWYRINATRNMTGGRRIQPIYVMSDKLKEVG